MATEISGTSIEFSQQSVGGVWSWKVRANNFRAAGQLYEVVDVNTPYGPLTTAAIPLPGEVVSAMAGSILDVQAQFAPLMVLGQSTVTFSIVITEGDPNSEVGTATVYNGGAFGSFMTVTATPSTSWLSASPSSYQNLGKNERATFNLSLLSSSLLASGSPYSGVVNLQDSRTSPTIIPFTVTVTVLPRPLIVSSPSSIGLTFISSTGTPGGSQQLTVTNNGPATSSLDFDVSSLQSSTWLGFTPTFGGPLAVGSSSIITISVIPLRAQGLSPGSYTDTLRITSTNASNSPVDVGVVLTVLA